MVLALNKEPGRRSIQSQELTFFILLDWVQMPDLDCQLLLQGTYRSVVVLNHYSACDDLCQTEMDQLCPDAPESIHLLLFKWQDLMGIFSS